MNSKSYKIAVGLSAAVVVSAVSVPRLLASQTGDDSKVTISAPGDKIDAQTESKLSRKVSVTFKDSPAKDAIDWLGQQGLNYVVEDSEITGRKINVNLEGVTLRDAANAIADALGGHWVHHGDVFTFKNGRALGLGLGGDGSFSGFGDMSGLPNMKVFENLKDLKGMDLKGMDLKDLQELKGLNGMDLKGLQELKGLKDMDLKGMDLKGLQELKGLKGMEFKDFPKMDLKGLEDMKLDLKGLDGMQNYKFDGNGKMSPEQAKKFGDEMKQWSEQFKKAWGPEMEKWKTDMKAWAEKHKNDKNFHAHTDKNGHTSYQWDGDIKDMPWMKDMPKMPAMPKFNFKGDGHVFVMPQDGKDHVFAMPKDGKGSWTFSDDGKGEKGKTFVFNVPSDSKGGTWVFKNDGKDGNWHMLENGKGEKGQSFTFKVPEDGKNWVFNGEGKAGSGQNFVFKMPKDGKGGFILNGDGKNGLTLNGHNFEFNGVHGLLGGQDLGKLAKSLTSDQKAKQDRQGYLNYSDLTPEQQHMLGHMDPNGSWELQFQAGDQKLVLKSDKKQ